MSDNETNVVENTEDLGEFEKLFYGQESTPAEENDEVEDEVDEEVEDEESDTEDAQESDEDDDDEADPTEDESEDEESDDEDEEEDEKPQRRNRKTAKERIQELNYEKKLAEQRLQDAMARLEKLEAQKPSEEQKEVVEDKAPDFNAKGKDGEPVYPLGEFDPAYIRDLTRYTIAQEQALADKARQEKAEQERIQAERQVRQEQWQEKLAEAQEELPDLTDKIASLGHMFENIEPNYGQYLVDIIQGQLEHGPAILHYLADHPKEARSIVNSGHVAASIALGKLDAQINSEMKRLQQAAKVSKAPPPPKKTPKGAGAAARVRPDTDDLTAFERTFFKKK